MKKLDHIFRIAVVAEKGSIHGRIIKSFLTDEEEPDSTFIVSFHQHYHVFDKKRLKLEIWFIQTDEKYFHLEELIASYFVWMNISWSRLSQSRNMKS